MIRLLSSIAVSFCWLAIAFGQAKMVPPSGVMPAIPAIPAIPVPGWLVYRNDTNVQIIVQASVFINKQEVRGAPHVINPKETAWDQVSQRGLKTITILDAATKRTLHREDVNYNGKDLIYSVQLDAAAMKAKKEVCLTLAPTTLANVAPGKNAAIQGNKK